MIVIAIDTAGVNCSVALFNSDRNIIAGKVSDAIGRGHAERLMDILNDALAMAGVTLRDVGRIAVSVGPGSFTGLRVGVAAARGLGLALCVPVVGVSTLAALAAASGCHDRGVIAAIDARRGEIYCQRFAAGLDPITLPGLLDIKAFRRLARDGGLVVGSAARILEVSPDKTHDAADLFDIESIARLALDERHALEPAPLYLRGPNARRQDEFSISRA